MSLIRQERDYEAAIMRACHRGDNDEAFELSIGLTQYRKLYKDHRAFVRR